MISMMFVMVPRASVSAGRIADVLASESSVQDAPQPRHLPEKVKGLVQFNDVSFHYEGADENVLEHVTFTARPGETTAFIVRRRQDDAVQPHSPFLRRIGRQRHSGRRGRSRHPTA